ncbi:MAG: hypothetical protein FWE56_01745 [Candidatus Bathyarchaeota archaeon]|nr:hypothetical protein [Candidatus Termiticorpusculum sp.]MCL2868856.1 hypothetical protein [Candidatus Termiticorpusculum sp.]
MDKNCVKKVWTPKNKIFSVKLFQEITRKQINNKSKAANIRNIESITKKLALKEPIIQKILDPKTHWLNTITFSISSTTIFSKKDAEVQNVV